MIEPPGGFEFDLDLRDPRHHGTVRTYHRGQNWIEFKESGRAWIAARVRETIHLTEMR